MAERDYISEIKNARHRGLQEGLAEGLAKGKAEGIAKTARNLKKEGFENLKIAEITGLSIEEIEKL